VVMGMEESDAFGVLMLRFIIVVCGARGNKEFFRSLYEL